MTMVDTLYDAHYGSREKLAWAFAEILNDEARAIEAAGVDVLQFDEPAFNVYFDEVRDWGIAALERAAAGPALQDRGAHLLRLRHPGQHRVEKVAGRTVAAVREHLSPARRARRIDQVSLECANSNVPLELIGLLQGKDVLVGAIDVATERVESAEEVAATIRAALEFVPAEKIYACTNCGMVPLPREVARAKLGGAWRRRGAAAAGIREALVGLRLRFDLRPGPAYSPLRVLFQVLKHDPSGSLAVAEAPYFPVLEIETSAGCDPIFFLIIRIGKHANWNG